MCVKSLHAVITGTILCLATAASAEEIKGLHITRHGQLRGRHNVNDTLGNTWDLHCNYGSIYHGTNYLYSNALRLNINGGYFNSSNCSTDKSGSEFEVGPWNHHGLSIYRRIKIYKAAGLARWLDIYHNPSGTDKQVNIRVQTQLNYGINQRKTNTGQAAFSSKDFAMWTRSPANNTPAALHIPHGPKSKMRMNVNVSGNNLQYTSSIKVPAGKTVIIAYFEGQNQNTAQLDKIMKSFSSKDYFADLPPSVRKLIANFKAYSGIMDIDLERSSNSDRVVLIDGNTLYGRIKNTSFKLISSFGELELPAARVIGMKAKEKNISDFLAILTDGQIVSGRLPGSTIEIHVPGIGNMWIPFSDIKTWTFKAAEESDEDIPFSGPFLIMRSGDRLIFAPESVRFRLQTRNGGVELKGDTMYRIVLSDAKHSVHRVLFKNGSILSGLLEPNELNIDLQLKPGQTILRNDLVRIEFAAEKSPENGLASIIMSSGDKFFGQLVEDTVPFTGKHFGTGTAEDSTISIQRKNIRQITRLPSQKNMVRLKIWNEKSSSEYSTTDVAFVNDTLKFRIMPGPVIEFSTMQMESLTRPRPLTSKKMREKVERLIAQLGSESYKDRKEAHETLQEMGPSITAQLEKHSDDEDPEIRERIKEILKNIKANNAAEVPPPPAAVGFAPFAARGCNLQQVQQGGWGG